MSCIFCKIISKEIPSEVISENNDILVIKDLHPKAPIHYLIIPKKHIVNIKELHDNDILHAAQIMITARELSKRLSGDGSFRLVMNNGSDSGQSVFHIHCHFLSGKKMLDF